MGGPALLALLTSPARADVLTVDAQGAADFTDLQLAVLAAAEGDTLLVRSGTYGSVEIELGWPSEPRGR